MKIHTKHFGVMEYSEKDIVSFPEGLFGFETHKDYVPIAFEEGNDSLLCLQSIADENISFIIMNPFHLLDEYDPILSNEDRIALNNPEDSSISYYVICVLRDPIKESTVNLKCPIVVNFKTKNARQVILNQPDYNFRHILKIISKKEGNYADSAKKKR